MNDASGDDRLDEIGKSIADTGDKLNSLRCSFCYVYTIVSNASSLLLISQNAKIKFEDGILNIKHKCHPHHQYIPKTLMSRNRRAASPGKENPDNLALC
nr:hypothetical protein CFP56_69075 [Quercus suber]